MCDYNNNNNNYNEQQQQLNDIRLYSHLFSKIIEKPVESAIERLWSVVVLIILAFIFLIKDLCVRPAPAGILNNVKHSPTSNRFTD